jgi:hypothetical protein
VRGLYGAVVEAQQHQSGAGIDAFVDAAGLKVALIHDEGCASLGKSAAKAARQRPDRHS